MKKKILYLILLLCVVAMPLGVKADTGYSIITSPPPGGADGGASEKVYAVPEYIGVRVSLVAADGTRINNTSSVDFFSPDLHTTSDYNLYYTSAKKNRIEVLNSSIKPEFVNKGHYCCDGCEQYCKPGTPNVNSLFITNDEYEQGKSYGIINALKNKEFNYGNVANAFISITDNQETLEGFIKKYFNVSATSSFDFKNWFLLVEPLITVRKDGHSYVVGTVTELAKYAYMNGGFMPGDLSSLKYDYHVHWNYIAFDTNKFTGQNVNSPEFVGLKVSSIDPQTSKPISTSLEQMATEKKGYGVGLIWLGKNAKKQDTCSSVTLNSDFPVTGISGNKIVSSTVSYPSGYIGYHDNKQGYNPSYYINAVCYSAPTSTTCSDQVTNTKQFPLSQGAKLKKILLESNYNDEDYKGYYDPNSGYNTDYYVNKMCYGDSSLSCADYYYITKKFNKVPLDAAEGKETNCCIQYENDEGTDKNRLYRDHPECYSCAYTELGGLPICETGANSTTVGDSFGSTGAGNNQTCAYYVASGKIDNGSSELLTRRIINSYCKVVCTEKVNITFPLLERKHYQKGAFIVWPTGNLFQNGNSKGSSELSKFFWNSDSSSKLIAHGTADCWYYVDTVGLNILRTEDSSSAANSFIQCANDFKNTYISFKNDTGEKNIINYNLKGTYSVEYNDDDYKDKIVSLNGNNGDVRYSVTGSIQNLNNLGVSYSLSDLKKLVSVVENITFRFEQSANYTISKDSGYNYIYDKQYHTDKESKWGKNFISLPEPALGLANKTYNYGELKIHYSNIGGGSKLYASTNTTPYGTCKYSTVDISPYHCPEGTPNAGMYLNGYMQLENLSYEEAIEKYCIKDLNIGKVCPAGTSFAGRKITDACYADDMCRNLTCNQYACTTQDGKTDKLLNSCISDEMEKDNNLTFDGAKVKCEKKYCGKANLSDSVEYRVIDLNNPFPGISAKNNGIKLSNGVIVGRTPGQNWNSASLVSNEILNNRGVSGNEVYSLDPLFEFDLTTSVMQKIRSYNDKHDYDDFTLRCTSDDKEACVASGFNIRSKDYGNISTLEACGSINNLDDFNRCYNS